jgi:hypothetical protein
MHQPCSASIGEVPTRLLDGSASCGIKLCISTVRPVADGGGDVTAAPSRQQGKQAVADPRLSFWRTATEEGAASEPQVLEHVHDIEDEGDFDASALRLGLYRPELSGLAIDQNDPVAAMLRVAT